jgi:hypothetical protein
MPTFATLSGERTAILLNGKYLFNLQLALFKPLQITSMMTMLNADSLYSLCHHRLAHISDQKLVHMSQQADYVNRGIIIPAKAVRRVRMEEYCDACMLENPTRKDRRKQYLEKAINEAEIGVLIC